MGQQVKIPCQVCWYFEDLIFLAVCPQWIVLHTNNMSLAQGRKCHIDLFLAICRGLAFCNPLANGTVPCARCSNDFFLQIFQGTRQKLGVFLLLSQFQDQPFRTTKSFNWMTGSAFHAYHTISTRKHSKARDFRIL